MVRTLFPPRTLALNRSVSGANMPDTCTATLPGELVEDGTGGGEYSEGAEMAFACRTWPLNEKQMETMVADQLREPGLEGLAYPLEVDLPVTATLVVTRATGGEQRYEVKGIVPDPTFAMHRRAIIKRTNVLNLEEVLS